MNNKMILPFACDSSGKIVSVDDVANGHACNCICPECKQPLIAKNNGKKRKHHFAHLANTDCKTGYQTAIHLMAKEIIKEEKLFIFGKRFLQAENVVLEKRIDDIIPDTFVHSGGIPFIIEIYVTHKVDEEKEQKIKKQEIPAVEIDLSKSTAMTKNELKKDIFDPRNSKIINNPVSSRMIILARPQRHYQQRHFVFRRQVYTSGYKMSYLKKKYSKKRYVSRRKNNTRKKF